MLNQESELSLLSLNTSQILACYYVELQIFPSRTLFPHNQQFTSPIFLQIGRHSCLENPNSLSGFLSLSHCQLVVSTILNLLPCPMSRFINQTPATATTTNSSGNTLPLIPQVFAYSALNPLRYLINFQTAIPLAIN